MFQLLSAVHKAEIHKPILPMNKADSKYLYCTAIFPPTVALISQYLLFQTQNHC